MRLSVPESYPSVSRSRNVSLLFFRVQHGQIKLEPYEWGRMRPEGSLTRDYPLGTVRRAADPRQIGALQLHRYFGAKVYEVHGSC